MDNQAQQGDNSGSQGQQPQAQQPGQQSSQQSAQKPQGQGQSQNQQSQTQGQGQPVPPQQPPMQQGGQQQGQGQPVPPQQPPMQQGGQQQGQGQPVPPQQPPMQQGGQQQGQVQQNTAPQHNMQGAPHWQDPNQPVGGMNQPAPPMPPAGPAPGGSGKQEPPANFQLGQLIKEIKVKLPEHNLQFDESKFLKLLAGSISLSKDEKKRIIDAIPRLSQQQVDELIRIFEEERQKFAELSGRHVPELERLAKQYAADWEDIELSYVQNEKASEDQQKADEIRKNLGL